MILNFAKSLAVLLVLTIGTASADVVNVNFLGSGSNADVAVDGTAFSAGFAPIAYDGTTFNDIATGTTASADLLDSSGASSGIGFSIDLNGNSGFTFSDTIDPGVSTIFANYLAPNQNFSSAPDASPITITFTGLDDSITYNFAFLAAGDSPGQGGDFTINGTTLTSLGTPNSALAEGSNFVSFSNVSSTGGALAVTVAPSTGGDQNFIAINGFQIQAITAVPEPSSAAVIGLGCVALSWVRRRKQS